MPGKFATVRTQRIIVSCDVFAVVLLGLLVASLLSDQEPTWAFWVILLGSLNWFLASALIRVAVSYRIELMAKVPIPKMCKCGYVSKNESDLARHFDAVKGDDGIHEEI